MAHVPSCLKPWPSAAVSSVESVVNVVQGSVRCSASACHVIPPPANKPRHNERVLRKGGVDGYRSPAQWAKWPGAAPCCGLDDNNLALIMNPASSTSTPKPPRATHPPSPGVVAEQRESGRRRKKHAKLHGAQPAQRERSGRPTRSSKTTKTAGGNGESPRRRPLGVPEWTRPKTASSKSAHAQWRWRPTPQMEGIHAQIVFVNTSIGEWTGALVFSAWRCIDESLNRSSRQGSL
ncbi:hypothetical protein HPB47_026197 [Ixodes persulcatus]|uniref:Uncharacterized protein n=1 Tax=Ixodes persulcatus TaxID=34615 RepID=A0AC60Q120_IXOPE|nr:hypothetical protein HPB47_026197 [Ixodes persulcatus]